MKHQLTVKELEKFLSLIENKDTKVLLGYGETAEPLRYIVNRNGSLLLHSDLYKRDQTENWTEVISLNM